METYNEDILALKLNGYPFVLVDRYFQGVETNVVHSDGFLGGKLAVDYLWSLGHRDIAICSDSPLSTITVEDRINGYLEELKNKKAMINPALILNLISPSTTTGWTPGIRCTGSSKTGWPPPTSR